MRWRGDGERNPAAAGWLVRAGGRLKFRGHLRLSLIHILRLLKRELSPHGQKSGEIRYRGVPLEQLSDREAASKIGFVSNLLLIFYV